MVIPSEGEFLKRPFVNAWKSFSARTGLPTEVVIREVPVAIPLAQATCLYRSLQESLQNVKKHAEATNILVRLLCTRNGLGICIHDDGRGFDQSEDAEPRKGLGLTSMAERVRTLQGTFHVRSKAGHGTEIHVTSTRSSRRPSSPGPRRRSRWRRNGRTCISPGRCSTGSGRWPSRKLKNPLTAAGLSGHPVPGRD